MGVCLSVCVAVTDTDDLQLLKQMLCLWLCVHCKRNTSITCGAATVCTAVFLFFSVICQHNRSKSCGWIFMKFGEQVDYQPKKN